MIKCILLNVLFLLLIIVSPVFAGESKVYTDTELEDYKTGHEAETYQYNQQILQRQNTISAHERMQDSYNEQQAEYRKKMNRISEIEEQTVQEKIDWMHKRDKRLNQSEVMERNEKKLRREMELDRLKRETGQGEARDAQKLEERVEAADREAEDAESKARRAERKARDAERKARDAEMKVRDAEMKARGDALDAERKARQAEIWKR